MASLAVRCRKGTAAVEMRTRSFPCTRRSHLRSINARGTSKPIKQLLATGEISLPPLLALAQIRFALTQTRLLPLSSHLSSLSGCLPSLGGRLTVPHSRFTLPQDLFPDREVLVAHPQCLGVWGECDLVSTEQSPIRRADLPTQMRNGHRNGCAREVCACKRSRPFSAEYLGNVAKILFGDVLAETVV